MLPRSRFEARQSKKFIERRQTRVIIIIALILISCATWLFSISRATHLNMFTVQAVNVHGADNDIIDSLQAAVYESMNGDYLGLFSKSNILLYPENKIITDVKQVSPRVESVSIKEESASSIGITVIEKTPAAIVCAGFPNFATAAGSDESVNDCYFADKAGYIFKAAPEFSGSVYNRYYIPDLGSAAIGNYATSSEKFAALLDFYNGVMKANISVAAILVKEGGEYELYARNPVQGASVADLSDSDTAVIYFNDLRPFNDQLLNLVSFWKDADDKARKTHQRPAFEFIDVRYGSNVFYRYAM